jgi:hypothetical protein
MDVGESLHTQILPQERIKVVGGSKKLVLRIGEDNW